MGGKWLRDNEIIGKRKNHLVALSVFRVIKNGHTIRMIHCICDCGKTKDTRARTFISGEIVSCGCIDCHKMKHGHARKNNRTYSSWRNMITRCHNQNTPHYDRYGGRGICVCDRWLGSDGFINFLLDMGERPVNKTLDRIDVNGNYCKENCKWSTAKEQLRNLEHSRFVYYHGEYITIAELAERFGLYTSLLERRIAKGWGIDRACVEPIKKAKKYLYNGAEYNIHELSKFTDVVNEKRLGKRLLSGWSVHDAMFIPRRAKRML